MGGRVRHISPQATGRHGITVTGDLCSLLPHTPSPASADGHDGGGGGGDDDGKGAAAVVSDRAPRLEGCLIPGKNGRLPLPRVENISTALHPLTNHVDATATAPPLDRGGGGLGLQPRGGGFCACWLRGRHCSQKTREDSGHLSGNVFCVPVVRDSSSRK